MFLRIEQHYCYEEYRKIYTVTISLNTFQSVLLKKFPSYLIEKNKQPPYNRK